MTTGKIKNNNNNAEAAIEQEKLHTHILYCFHYEVRSHKLACATKMQHSGKTERITHNSN